MMASNILINNDDIYNWNIDAPRAVDEYIDDASQVEEYLTKNELINIPLLEYQLRDIYAMSIMETKSWIMNREMFVYSKIGVLTEPFGSGKTLIVLGLCSYVKAVKCTEDLQYYSIIQSKNDNPYCAIARRKFKNISKTNIVFCAASVVPQWVDTIKNYTKLKYFVITDVFHLRTLYNELKDDASNFNKYDIIVIKNGTISGVFEFQGYKKKINKLKSRTLFNIFSNISINLGITWNRLFLDDFDTLCLRMNFTKFKINALYTWIVTGSNIPNNNASTKIDEFDNIPDFLDHAPIIDVVKQSSLIYTNMCVRISCSQKFTDACLNIPKPSVRTISFHNPNDEVINLIGLMDSKDMIEMLNSDAIETAAASIGSKNVSVPDIFKRLIGNNYEIYDQINDSIEFIKSLLEMDMNELETSKSYSYDLEQLRKKKKPKYRVDIQDMCETELKKLYEERKSVEIIIDRVKSNIAEGECMICSNDLDLETITISKCCAVVVCAMCCISTSLMKHSCCRCRHYVSVDDIVFIRGGFDLEKIIENDADYKFEPEVEETPPNKIDTLVNIINSVPQEYLTRNINIAKVLMGTVDAEQAPPEDRRFVVFATFDESIADITKRLVDEKIEYGFLEGTVANLAETVNNFRLGVFKVLILKSTKHSAGLNLQFATDVIYMHKILDVGVEGQTIGRLQRYGRKYTANIWYLLYNNEYSYFNFV